MVLHVAEEKHFADVVELANLAYRKTGAGASWNSEEGLIGGQRMDESVLREDLTRNPDARLLIHRDTADGALLGTVWLEPKGEGVWYLGLLMVRPDRQSGGLGKAILAAGEEFVKQHGGRRMRMTVLSVRDELLAWYQRRGYAPTGETQPFPYGDERFGVPKREGLFFVVVEKDIAV
jgi:GNAT superfamily N-acetyltransferase